MRSYDADEDAYAILGAAPEATGDEIEAAYRKAVLTWHPDKSPAPDAADRFQQVLRAAKVLRDPVARKEYDRRRTLHHGRAPRRRREPEAHVPMMAPPAWLADRVRVHFDAVLLTLETPRPSAAGARAIHALAFVALGMALVTGQIMVGALSVVLWAIGRVAMVPPHDGELTWARLVPGRRLAEFHSLNQRIARYESIEVPFSQLCVAVVSAGSVYHIQIHGFPRLAVPILHSTRDYTEAKRCAREVGRWLRLPLARAA